MSSAFAVAVQAVIEDLERAGFEIREAAFEGGCTPHVVAERHGRLQFVLVQGIEGPRLEDFSEEVHYARMLAMVEAVTWHPKVGQVGQFAAANHADARLAMVGLLSTDVTELGGETGYFAKVFPYRNIDPSGHVTAIA